MQVVANAPITPTIEMNIMRFKRVFMKEESIWKMKVCAASRRTSQLKGSLLESNSLERMASKCILIAASYTPQAKVIKNASHEYSPIAKKVIIVEVASMTATKFNREERRGPRMSTSRPIVIEPRISPIPRDTIAIIESSIYSASFRLGTVSVKMGTSKPV